MGTTVEWDRGSASHRRVRSVACNVSLEGRWSRRSRAECPRWDVEDYTFTVKLSGETLGVPWDDLPWSENQDADDDWSFASATDDTPQQLYEFWDNAVSRSRLRLVRALANGGLGQLVHVCDSNGNHASLRRLVCDLIEEYGRHTGHADLLRESVDGRVGEDPPSGWGPHPTRQPE
jgi:hypothetical protein